MLVKFCLINLIATLAIALSEKVESEKIKPESIISFPDSENDLKENQKINNENEEKPTPRESKDLKYVAIPNNFQSRNANPIGDNYEIDDYDESIGDNVNDDYNYDYKVLARSEPVDQVNKRKNSNQINSGISVNTKKSTADNPRIYTLRDGLDLFRNFWRSRTPVKEKEVLPVITLTTTPTVAAVQTIQAGQNDDFGTVTGTATGTGTMTAASADEIAQNNVATLEPETSSPFFSFSRRQPIRYEIIEEDLEPYHNNNNIFVSNSDYIDITGDETQRDNAGKTSIPMMSTAVIQKENNRKEMQLPRRKNAKQPVKVLSEIEKEIEKPKIVQEAVPTKNGLEYYREYLPNLRKLIEIRPKLFINRMFPGFKSKVENENGSTRDLQGKSAPPRRRQNNLNSSRSKKPIPNIVGIVDADHISKSNRLPVKRVQLYLV